MPAAFAIEAESTSKLMFRIAEIGGAEEVITSFKLP
jgi:hypothetical protein